jgi:hypothetical protein
MVAGEPVNWKTGGVLKSIATDGIVKGDVNDELSVEALVKLREQTEAELNTNLITVKAQIAEANQVLAEYEAAVQG